MLPPNVKLTDIPLIDEVDWSKPIFQARWKNRFPEGHAELALDHGDPFALKVPDGVDAPFRYYIYCTGDGGRTDKLVPVYGTNDLLELTRLPENAAVGDMKCHHWAPCAVYVKGLKKPWVMIKSASSGENMDVGHKLHRLHASKPEGP